MNKKGKKKVAGKEVASSSKVLIQTHKLWSLKKGSSFNGPIAFLLCFYVDRYVHCRRRLNRSYPTVKGWTKELMKMRQADEDKMGRFGLGSWEHRINREEILKAEAEQAARDCDKSRSEQNVDNVHDADRAMNELMKAGVQMASAITVFVDKLKAVPQSMKGVGIFKIATEAAMNLMGLTQVNPVDRPENADVVHNLTQAMHDEDCNNTQWLDAVEAMMKAYERKMELDYDGPTFSLGFDFTNPNDNHVDQHNEVDSNVHKETVNECEITRPSEVVTDVPTRPSEVVTDVPLQSVVNQNAQLPQVVVADVPLQSVVEEGVPEKVVVETEIPQPMVVECMMPESNNSEQNVPNDGEIIDNSKGKNIPINENIPAAYQSFTVVNPPNGWEEKQICDRFHSRVMDEVKVIPGFDWGNYDLIFFPICASDHYYLVCFDLVAMRVNVIDNSLAETHVTFDAKYGRTPTMLRRFLVSVLLKCNKNKQAGEIKNKGTKSLEILRAKFCRALLEATDNIRSKLNIAIAKDHWKKDNKEKKINMPKFLANYGIK
ncbi:hypothetical protein AAHA92_22497 [Salvia divinorum]|uniref:Ubiquitin-like protease family profile domain-containing protein n=1 Tax=Salvia divinorum TaxID=28513 RepID=A0ABD1GNV6_SALDI